MREGRGQRWRGRAGAVSKADEGASEACKSSHAVVCRCAKLAEEWPIAEWPTGNQGRRRRGRGVTFPRGEGPPPPLHSAAASLKMMLWALDWASLNLDSCVVSSLMSLCAVRKTVFE